MKILFKSFLAGIMIAIGGTVFLSIENKVIGASLFSIGLFGVLIYNLNLYTGKIGYLITNFNLKYIKSNGSFEIIQKLFDIPIDEAMKEIEIKYGGEGK